MRWCRVHSVRYHRLWRLPSIRTIATAVIVTVVVVVVSAGVGPLWVPTTVLALGAAAVAFTVRRHRHRIALEAHMVRTLIRSSRGCPDSIDLPGLGADVHAEAMPDGVTRIDAVSWLDAVRALGFVMGRDRGFQLDWLRRMAAGRLAEVWGSTALAVDVGYRSLALFDAAGRALEHLDREELELLQAFAAGVTASWDQDGPPFECRFLTYRPEPWTPVDSLSITLLLFHGLSWKEQSKRAEAVIQRVFPESVARFFLPGSGDGDPPLPESLHHFRACVDPAADIIAVDSQIAGSNCWIQAAAERPILACDLHLPLSMPNPLYEVDFGWSGMRVRGLMAAGLPVVLTGTNGRLVWGVTNLNADVLDLIPANAEDGRSTAPVTESQRIRVRQRPDTVIEVARAAATLVSPRPLLGETVAVRWTGYDPRACDLRFQRLAHATTLDESIAVLDRSDGIALNVLVADESGRMAHLATGLIPRRGPDSAAAGEGISPASNVHGESILRAAGWSRRTMRDCPSSRTGLVSTSTPAIAPDVCDAC